MLKKIFEDIRKKGSFSFEKIIENYTMSDDEFFEFLKFIHLEMFLKLEIRLMEVILLCWRMKMFLLRKKTL